MEPLVKAVTEGLRAFGLEASYRCDRYDYGAITVAGCEFSFYPRRTMLQCCGQSFRKTESTELAQRILRELPRRIERRDRVRTQEAMQAATYVARQELRKHSIRCSIDSSELTVHAPMPDAAEIIDMLLLYKYVKSGDVYCDKLAILRSTIGHDGYCDTTPVMIYADYLDEIGEGAEADKLRLWVTKLSDKK